MDVWIYELTINVYWTGEALAHAVPHVAKVHADGLVDDLEAHAVGAIPLHLPLKGNVLLLPVEEVVLRMREAVIKKMGNSADLYYSLTFKHSWHMQMTL